MFLCLESCNIEGNGDCSGNWNSASDFISVDV